MIKICSLDFLNREVFETDIMTVDGRILFHNGEKITPNILLRLYFKEIYIKEPLPEKELAEAYSPMILHAALEETAEMIPKLTNPNKIDEEMAIASKSSNTDEVEEEKIKGSKAFETNPIEEKEETIKGPRVADIKIKEENNSSSGPKNADLNLDEKATKEVDSAYVSKMENNQEKIENYSDVGKDFNKEAGNEIEESEDALLVFDEEQAKRIVEHSLKLGKLLKFSANELKELEQVAYYCNIGISEFKKSDLRKKGFRKRKAFAGYEKLLNEGKVNEKIAEIVKFCANDYESDSFPLNSQIPCHQIVAVTSFYEELLMQNNSKQATLLKMLQIGGNQFNIFILHKFIKIMREAND